MSPVEVLRGILNEQMKGYKALHALLQKEKASLKWKADKAVTAEIHTS